MNNIVRAESAITVLVAMLLFALMWLVYVQWQAVQNQQAILLFQRQQALQIAENQIARQMAGLGCERRVQQNGVSFQIEKCSVQQILIRFPTGEVKLGLGS